MPTASAGRSTSNARPAGTLRGKGREHFATKAARHGDERHISRPKTSGAHRVCSNEAHGATTRAVNTSEQADEKPGARLARGRPPGSRVARARCRPRLQAPRAATRRPRPCGESRCGRPRARPRLPLVYVQEPHEGPARPPEATPSTAESRHGHRGQLRMV